MTLIQEEIRDMVVDEFYDWGMLCMCILLNRTRGAVVRKIYHEFFQKFPTPRSLVETEVEDIASTVKVCGFQYRKALLLKAMSEAYLRGTPFSALPGVGPYASDSYAIFVKGSIDHMPSDHALSRYVQKNVQILS